MPQNSATLTIDPMGYISRYNNTRTINVTITYKPSFSDIDTIYTGPMMVRSLLNTNTYKIGRDSKKLGVKNYYFVNEKHLKGNRYHMHGQILVHQAMSRSEEIERFETLYHALSKKFGRVSMKWNNPEVKESDETDYPTYTHYCFKESSQTVIECNCDDTNRNSHRHCTRETIS